MDLGRPCPGSTCTQSNRCSFLTDSICSGTLCQLYRLRARKRMDVDISSRANCNGQERVQAWRSSAARTLQYATALSENYIMSPEDCHPAEPLTPRQVVSGAHDARGRKVQTDAARGVPRCVDELHIVVVVQKPRPLALQLPL